MDEVSKKLIVDPGVVHSGAVLVLGSNVDVNFFLVDLGGEQVFDEIVSEAAVFLLFFESL